MVYGPVLLSVHYINNNKRRIEEMNMISDITNTPVKMTICGKEVSVRQLGYPEILKNIEPLVKKQYMDEIRNTADLFTNAKERSMFIRDSINEIPRGEKLIEQCTEYLKTLDGIRVLIKLALKPSNPSDELIDNIMEDDVAVNQITEYAMSRFQPAKSEPTAEGADVPLAQNPASP